LESAQLPEAMKATTDDMRGAEWQAEIEQAQAKLDELAMMYAADQITRGEWLNARGKVEKRLTVAKKKLAALNRTTVLLPFIESGEKVRGQWPQMTLTRQQAIIAALIQHVEVLPARRGYNRFDRTRLRPVWRV